jgi:hypothetical protein
MTCRLRSPFYREISSSRHAALETAQLLYRFVGAAKFASIEQLIGMIKDVGTRLIAANPKGEWALVEGRRGLVEVGGIGRILCS